MNFRGEKRSNAAHQSTTDPEARLFKKQSRGAEARLGYLGHMLMEKPRALPSGRRRWRWPSRFPVIGGVSIGGGQ